jgi:hypothetical protein
MKLRDYQVEISSNAAGILKSKGIVYLSMQVRTGKTITSLETAKKFSAKDVLFLTKKKAISSIESDYISMGYDKDFNLHVINDESMHKINLKFDLVIHDEHHRFGGFPKAGKYTKIFKKMYGKLPHIYLSGTPSPESYSQLYHQFWVSDKSPFKESSFYKWANEYVRVRQIRLSHGTVNDYSDADQEKVMSVIREYMITYTQEQAGFVSEISEHVLRVKMKDSTIAMCNKLKRDLVLEGKDQVILADTSVKLMQKLHQMYSGTVKFESGESMVIDTSKAEFIRDRFSKNKIGIFYKFKEEYNALCQVFDAKNLTNNIDEFNETSKNIALQIVSGREGISLRNADYIVFYNIDFSATSYWQARDRMTTMDRKFNDIYWVFSEGGIEDQIYKSVINKKSYTLSHFKKDFNI